MKIINANFKSDRNTEYFVSEIKEATRVNPKDLLIASMEAIFYQLRKPRLRIELDKIGWTIENIGIFDSVTRNIAKQEAIDEFERIISTTSTPEFLKSLVDCNKKKDQVKLLKGVELSTYKLWAFFVWAYEEKGYLYSTFKGEKLPVDLENKTLPLFAHADEHKVVSSSDGELSDGQVRHMIKNRNVVIAKLIEKEDDWHMFILTYDSINGKEKGNEGRKHIHYISSLWGRDKTYVTEQVKSGKYKLPVMPHIPFERESDLE